MTTSRSPRRVTWLTGAGLVLLVIALSAWGNAAWTRWWVADLAKRPVHELDVPVRVEDGARGEFLFTPNAGIPHVLHLEFDSGLPTKRGGPSPVEATWKVRTKHETVGAGDGDDLAWRTGEPGMGIVWLGRFHAVLDEEHDIVLHVKRGLPGATARLLAVRDEAWVKGSLSRAALFTDLAWIPCGLGVLLLLSVALSGRFEIRRRG